MTSFEKKHSFNFFLLTVLLISFYIGGGQGGYNIFDDLVSKDIVGLICFFLILTVGISHGSLDNTKGKRILKLYKLKNISIFYLSYIFFALIIVLVWVFLPSISLMLFLIVASYHFGKEDSFLLNTDHKNNLYFFFRGLIIILAPLVFHTQETLEIFKTLLIKDNFLINSIIYLQNFYLLSILMSLSILVCIFFYKHFKELNLYGEIHRYMTLLSHFNGARITQVPIRHNARKFGVSKYGLERIFKVIYDLISLIYLQRIEINDKDQHRPKKHKSSYIIKAIRIQK